MARDLITVTEIASSGPLAPPRNDRVLVVEEDVRRLLDVISSIIADEYIRIAKQNRGVFMDSRFRGNDSEGGLG